MGRYLMIRVGFGDDMHRRLQAKVSECWFQYCSHLLTSNTRFFLLTVEVVNLVVSHVLREGRFVDLDLVVEYVFAFHKVEDSLTPTEFKRQLESRLQALRTRGTKRPRGVCHEARRALKLPPAVTDETKFHLAAVQSAAEKAVDVFARLKQLSETQLGEVRGLVADTLCPRYSKKFKEGEDEKVSTYLKKRAGMVGALVAREAFAQWAPQAVEQLPTDLVFKAKRKAATAKRFKVSSSAHKLNSFHVTRQDLLKVSSDCTISKVTQLLKQLGKIDFDLRAS